MRLARYPPRKTVVAAHPGYRRIGGGGAGGGGGGGLGGVRIHGGLTPVCDGELGCVAPEAWGSGWRIDVLLMMVAILIVCSRRLES